jgi:predicted DNA-binding protein (UPF0251 family)
MGRRRKPRWIDFQPQVTYFKPRGVTLASLEEVDLSLDEVEAVRLADLEGIDQTKAAKKMKISQSTFQRTLESAHKKIAQALILGRAIRMKGGEVIMPRGRRPGRGTGQGTGRGAGRGRMGGPFAAGPGGICLCTNPECKNEVTHQVGIPCYQAKCPKCGSPMVRKR